MPHTYFLPYSLWCLLYKLTFYMFLVAVVLVPYNSFLHCPFSNSVLYLFDPFTVLLIKLWIVSEFLLPRLYFLFALSHPIQSFSYLLSSKLQLYKLLMSFLLFRNLFWVIFSHVIFFKFLLPTWAFPVLKKFASKFISSAFAPPSRNNWLSTIGTFKK